MPIQLKFAKPVYENKQTKKKGIGNRCYEYKFHYYLNGGSGMLEYNNVFFGHYPKHQPDLQINL